MRTRPLLVLSKRKCPILAYAKERGERTLYDFRRLSLKERRRQIRSMPKTTGRENLHLLRSMPKPTGDERIPIFFFMGVGGDRVKSIDNKKGDRGTRTIFQLLRINALTTFNALRSNMQVKRIQEESHTPTTILRANDSHPRRTELALE